MVKKEMKINVLCLFLFLMIFIIPLVSAGDLVATSKTYDKQVKEDTSDFLKADFNTQYGLIQLSKSIELKPEDKIAEYSLVENTNYCDTNCYAQGKTTLYEDGYLFEKIEFLNIKKDKQPIELHYKTYFAIDYEEQVREVCDEPKFILNEKGDVEEVIRGECREERYQAPIWKEYNNDILPKGDYEWKIEATKQSNEDIDWVVTSFGKELTEWANWFSIAPFSATWNTSANSSGSTNVTTIKLPLYSGGIYNFTVNWGDGKTGNVTTFNSVNATHTYASAGVYTINITGTINGFRFNNAGDRLKINNVSQWGDLQTGNLNGYFYGCANLYSSATDNLNLTGVTNFINMFRSATNFNGNISNWNVSGITTMNSMFQSATNFNSNINNWNVGKVVNMTSMFQSATNFNQDISGWNTGKVVLMDDMFSSATNFNQPIGNWNTSSVTNMISMFESATNFNQNLTGWNTSNLKTISTMFAFASNFNGNVSTWDTSKINDMGYVFDVAFNFNQDVSKWNTSSVTTMANMFALDPAFNQNISGWDTSKVTSMTYMFYNNSIFNQSIGVWNTSNVNDMAFMFFGAVNFNQNLNNWDTSKVTTMNSMFSGATSFNGNISAWNTGKVASMGNMFFKAYNFNQNLENWNTSSVTSLVSMFYNAISFNSNLSNWDTSKVTQIDNLFRNASVFNGNVSNWNLSKLSATSESVFSGATAFNQPIGSWDVSRMISFNSWFANAVSFNQDLSNWNTSSATGMGGMFNNATSFNGNISNWNVGKVTSMSGMFNGDISFNQNLGSWNVSSASIMTNMFLGVNLSSSNYDALLIGWASLSPNLKNNTILNAGGSIYTNASLYARNILINSFNWTIIDGGLFVDLVKPTFVIIPANASIFYNQNFGVFFNATDETNLSSYSVNDTRFSINSTGFLTNISPLFAGNYEMNITINDTSNNINWTLYKLQVNKSLDNCLVYFNETSPLAYPNTFLVYTDCSSAFDLYRNGTLITNNTEQVLPISAYNFSVQRTDIQNYTNVFDEKEFSLADLTPPTIIVYNPLGATDQYNETIPFGIFVNDTSNNLSIVKAFVTKPDNSTEEIQMKTNPSQGTYIVENITVQPSQVCNASFGIVGGIPVARTSISGNGSPSTDTLCSFIAQKPLFGDFIATVDYNLTSLTLDSAINFQITSEQPTSANAVVYAYIGRTNFNGEGNQYQVYGEDSNSSGFLNKVNTNDVYGKMRIQRINDTFSFFVYNNSDASWILLGSHDYDMHEGIFLVAEAESINDNWGNADVYWSNFTFTGLDPQTYVGTFNDTSEQGTYYVQFFANDTKNNINNYTSAIFRINESNYAPSTPFITNPHNLEDFPITFSNQIVPITWAKANDLNNDIVIYNISLLNQDHTFNRTIVANYGNLSSNHYDWNAYNSVPSGNYSIEVEVEEVLTLEQYNKSDTLSGYFIINQIDIVPTIFTTIPADASLFYGNESLGVQFIGTDETAFDSYAVNDTANFAINQSGFLSNNTALPVGHYQVNVTINDTANNINWTLYNVEIKAQPIFDTTPPVITILSPANTVNSQTVNFTITTNELATCIYNLDSAGNISIGNNITFFSIVQTLSYGNHNVVYYCHDNSNNNNSISQTFNVHQASNGDIITGSSIPVAERFVSLVVSSPTFNYDTSGAVSVQALNPNGDAILLDNISVELLGVTTFTKSIITLNVNDTYKRSFNVANNQNITQLHFLITATKGDKTMTQDYYTNIIQGSFLNQVKVITIDFLTRYIVYIGLFFLFLILLVIIAQASRDRKKEHNRY